MKAEISHIHTQIEKTHWQESVKLLRINMIDAKRAAFRASWLSQDICVAVASVYITTHY